MVLNMADFGKSWKSLQTLWNASKTILKWFLTACATVCVDVGWIGRGRKLADFEQKAWAIAHGFEHGRFWQVLQIALNSLRHLQNRYKKISDCLRDCLCRFRVNSQGSKIGRFWGKSLGNSARFRTWRILVSTVNHSKLSLRLLKVFLTLCATVCVDFSGIRKGRKLAVLELKACGIPHGFEHFGWKSLQSLWNAS